MKTQNSSGHQARAKERLPERVPFSATPTGETPDIRRWAQPVVWTARMLTTLLENKVKGSDPIWIENVIRPDGTRRVLQRQPDGDCTFLGDAGCALPLETRPLICRIYPFDYTADGLRDELAHGCPMELLPAGQSLLQALDIKRSDAERWHKQLYAEVLTERNANEMRANP